MNVVLMFLKCDSDGKIPLFLTRSHISSIFSLRKTRPHIEEIKKLPNDTEESVIDR